MLGFFGMIFYVANWVEIYRHSALGLFSHTWSLAIEEQFYLVWPVILIFLLRRRLRLGTIAAIVTAGIVAAAGWRAWYWHSHFGPPQLRRLLLPRSPARAAQRPARSTTARSSGTASTSVPTRAPTRCSPAASPRS